MEIPSGRVSRAETWLTVYRSLYIWSKNLDDTYIYRVEVRGNFRDLSKLHINASKLASERFKRLDQRRVLSIPNFRKC